MTNAGGILNEGNAPDYPLERMLNGGRGRQKIVPLGATPDRVPPNSNEAEMAVLGAMMLEKEASAKAMQILSKDHFYRETHRLIYEAMISLADRNQPIDIITLNDELRRLGRLSDVGGSHYLSELNRRTPSAANVEHHARIVFERALKRMLISAANGILENCYTESTDAFEELDHAEQKMFEIGESRSTRSYQSMKRLAVETVEMLEAIAHRHRDGNGVIGVPTGLVKLDNLLGGFQRSDLVILAARPSMGKTALAMSIARNAAVDYKKAVAFFSLEMSAPQLVMRLIAAEAKIDASLLRKGDLKDEHWQSIASTIHRLTDAPIFIDDTPAMGIMELRARCRQMKREHNIEMVMVDYLQLMHAAKAESREREISVISRGLKQLAKELNIPVIALSQLNRSVESRSDKRPMLSDLRESGCLSGETLVTMADSGESMPIRSLVGQSGFAVWALNEQTMKLERAVVSNAFSTGVKQVFRLTTRSGRSIRATANHPFRTVEGWQRLDAIAIGTHIAVPRVIPAPFQQTMSDDELEMEYSEVIDTSTALFQQNLGRKRAARVAEIVESSELATLASSDVYWDSVVSIEADGIEEVFDLTVPGPHNFVANDIIPHNSIEQDADVVMFVHRPEYYGITVDEEGRPTNGIAEIIIGKQRNGPTGVTQTAFIKEFARFENLAFQYDDAPAYLPPANDEQPF